MRYVEPFPSPDCYPIFPRLSLFATLACLGLAVSPTARAADPAQVSQSPQPERSEPADTETKAEADRLFDQGIEQFKTSQFRAALQSWEQALQIYRQIGDRQGEANSLGNLGNAYYSLGDYAKAIDFQKQSLAIARDIGDRQGEANSLGNLGSAYHSLELVSKEL